MFKSLLLYKNYYQLTKRHSCAHPHLEDVLLPVNNKTTLQLQLQIKSKTNQITSHYITTSLLMDP